MIFDTTPLTPAGTGDPFLDYQVYNGLDNCITLEVHEALQAIPTTNSVIYDFERAMQAPALEMMLRGLRVDLFARDCAVAHLREQVAKLQDWLNELGEAVWDKPLNPKSPLQLKELFYQVMRLPEQHKIEKGQRKVSTNRDALEKLQVYFHAKPICLTILAIRDLSKQIEFLQSQVGPDQRMHTSYNVAGTETGRWSSSSDAFGEGANLQNFPDKLRTIFVADPGRKLAYCDLEQAESWIVGIRSWLCTGDDAYIQAILSGDLHTTVARMVWPNRPWTGEKSDRDLAEEKFYRDYSFRDLAKRGGHGSNYYGQPPTMAKHLKVTTQLMENFQRAYFLAFPGLPRWHRWVAQQLQLHGHLTTMVGRCRHFFGRSSDDSTLREAIAYEPQSVVGDLLNLAAYRIWRDGPRLGVRLLAQLHDAVLIDFPDNPQFEHKIAQFVTSLMKTEIKEGGRTFVIPNDFASGWNWGKFHPTRNPGGVRKIGKVPDPRQRPNLRGLDRIIPSFHS